MEEARDRTSQMGGGGRADATVVVATIQCRSPSSLVPQANAPGDFQNSLKSLGRLLGERPKVGGSRRPRRVATG
eukprot:6261130-Pyramimonas_sp.AAC.2